MNTVVRYNNPVNALINEFFNTSHDTAPRAKSYRPRIDIVEYEKEYKLYADLPGLSKKDVTITVEDGVLTISGEKERVDGDADRYSYFERNHGSFERRFNLPDEVSQENISAEMKNGELAITIQKAEKALPKKIDISIN